MQKVPGQEEHKLKVGYFLKKNIATLFSRWDKLQSCKPIEGSLDLQQQQFP